MTDPDTGTHNVIPIRGGNGHPTAVLTIILLTYFMILLDNSIVFTGVSRIRAELDFSAAGISWVTDAYALVFGGLLLLAARAGDIIGRRRIFVIGLVIFSLASLAIGLAPSAGFLLASRAVQGVGAAILAPTTLALLTANFAPGPARTRAIAAYGSVAGIGASVGLVVGGLVADLTSWRVGFLINVPIGAIMIAAAFRYLRETPRVPGRFDIAGAVTSTLGMTALVYGIIRSAEEGWTDTIVIVSLIAAVVLLVAFVLIEWRAAQPILPLRIFASRIRTGAFLCRMLFAGTMFGYFIYISQYMQDTLGFSPLLAGLGFLPMTVVNFAVAVLVPRLTARFGNSALIVSGLAVTLIGMIWLSRVTTDSDYITAVALPMILIGIGQGLGFAPLTAAGVTDVAPEDAGAASGLVNTAHQIGGSLGLGIMAAVAASAPALSNAAADTARRAGDALSTGSLLLGIAVIAAVALIIRWTRRPAATA
jgi:EmrB/QacA subfamily drug resistance transporter